MGELGTAKSRGHRLAFKSDTHRGLSDAGAGGSRQRTQMSLRPPPAALLVAITVAIACGIVTALFAVLSIAAAKVLIGFL